MAICISGRKNSERNDMIGIRTRATLYSQQAWQAAHRAATPWSLVVLAATAASLIVGAVLFNAEALPENTESWFSFTSISVFVVLMTALAWQADRAAKQVILEDISKDSDSEGEGLIGPSPDGLHR